MRVSRQTPVGEGVAPEVGKRAATRRADGVSGGPGEVGDPESQGSLHPGLLCAAGEEGRSGDERGVEGSAGQEDEDDQ